MSRFASLFAALLLVPGIAIATPVQTAAAPAPLPSRAEAIAAIERLADWQLAHLDDLDYISGIRPDTSNARDWQQATFWVALTHVADRSASPRFRDAILAKGQSLGWQLGDRRSNADDQLIGAVWIWASKNGAGPAALAPTRARHDDVLAAPPTGSLEFPDNGKGNPDCFDRWCWCDALFMAPPTLWALSKATGDSRYADFAHHEFLATTGLLFDPKEALFYRDSRFFDRRGAHDEKLFWSRGNGWVFAGLARIIPLIDANDPRRGYYVDLYRKMAAKLLTLQRPNGYWPPSLLGDPTAAMDETSGTGFYTFGLAWGIKAGLLDRAQYLPAVAKGWAALQRAVQPDGRLGWVQQVSDRPDAVAAADTQFYGTGAYLLAGAAVADLGEK